jgi:hypothetical protein
MVSIKILPGAAQHEWNPSLAHGVSPLLSLGIVLDLVAGVHASPLASSSGRKNI